MTSSLSAFLFSLIAGSFVLIAIAIAVTWVSANDPINRKQNIKVIDPIINPIKR
jgi:hypothetical protein